MAGILSFVVLHEFVRYHTVSDCVFIFIIFYLLYDIRICSIYTIQYDAFAKQTSSQDVVHSKTEVYVRCFNFLVFDHIPAYVL